MRALAACVSVVAGVLLNVDDGFQAFLTRLEAETGQLFPGDVVLLGEDDDSAQLGKTAEVVGIAEQERLELRPLGGNCGGCGRVRAEISACAGALSSGSFQMAYVSIYSLSNRLHEIELRLPASVPPDSE